MKHIEPEESNAFIVVEIIECVTDWVVMKTIIQKSTGTVNTICHDYSQASGEQTSPVDTFLQVIDGIAEVIIDDKSHLLETGESVTIPAHVRTAIKANMRFKMLCTCIRSKQEKVSEP